MTHEEILEELKERYGKMAKPMTFVYEALYVLRNEQNQVIRYTQIEIVNAVNENNDVYWSTVFVAKVLKQLAKDGYLYRKAGIRGEKTKYAFPKEEFFIKPSWEKAEKFDNLTNEMRIENAFKTLLPIADKIESEEQLEAFLFCLKTQYEYFVDDFKLNLF